MNRPWISKAIAVLAIVAGLGVLAIEVLRFRSGASREIWLWGVIGLLSVVFGVWELVAGKEKEP